MQSYRRPLVIVDLAVPRDFEPEAAQIPGVHLFNIDDLNRVIAENVRCRHGEMPKAEEIVESAVRAFESQMAYLEVEPVIRHLRDRFEQIRLGELQRFLGQFRSGSYPELNALTQSLVKKLLHELVCEHAAVSVLQVTSGSSRARRLICLETSARTFPMNSCSSSRTVCSSARLSAQRRKSIP